MFDWWPRILPFIGPTWAYCARYGNIKDEESDWQVKLFIVGWWHWAMPLYQFDPPRRVESENEQF